jgi:hypothetical protein
MGVHHSTNDPLDGRIGEAAIWNVALNQAECEALAAGFSPLFIRPASLVNYWDMVLNADPLVDRMGNDNLTATNTPTQAGNHPPIIMPRAPILGITAGAAPAGDVRPPHYHHRHHNLAG